MKVLKQNEIDFLKKTGFTPTIYQCNEWSRTSVGSLEKAEKIAAEYGIDLHEFYSVLMEEYDSISLENEAAYILSVFFANEELAKMTDADALKFLQDWKYHLGFRKWSEWDAMNAIAEAQRIHEGFTKVTSDADGNLWLDYEEKVDIMF